MPYKRFSPISDTFLVTPFGSVFRQIEFFNSHACLHHLGKQPAQHGLCRFFRSIQLRVLRLGLFRSIQLRVLRLGFFQDGDFTGPR
jgi:hypothetical protein